MNCQCAECQQQRSDEKTKIEAETADRIADFVLKHWAEPPEETVKAIREGKWRE